MSAKRRRSRLNARGAVELLPERGPFSRRCKRGPRCLPRSAAAAVSGMAHHCGQHVAEGQRCCFLNVPQLGWGQRILLLRALLLHGRARLARSLAGHLR